MARMDRTQGFYGHGTPQLMVVFKPGTPYASTVYPEDYPNYIPRRYAVEMPEGGLEWCAVTYELSQGWPVILMDARRPEEWDERNLDHENNAPTPEIHEMLRTCHPSAKKVVMLKGRVETAQLTTLDGFRALN